MNLPFSLARMRRFAPLLLVLLGAAVAVAAYMQALDYPFVSDDDLYLTENTKLAGLHLTELWRLFTEPYNSAFEFLPLRDLSYWLDIKLFGMNPSTSRIHNIVLYLLCLPLAYATTLELWRYFRPADASAPWAAAAVTALFALHPALVESVVWISGRKYVLPNLLSMLALWLAMHTRRERGLSAPHVAASLIAFVAVMLSKSSYVGVAPVIAILWMLFWLDIPKPERRRSHLLWPLAILFLAGLLTLIFIAKNKGLDGEPFYFGVEAATRTLAVLGWMARLAVSPEGRHLFYPVFDDPYLPVMVALGVAVLAAAVAGAAMILRRRSLEGFSLIAFLLLCMPYMQLIPNHPPSLVSDRYLALAVYPIMLLLVSLTWRLRPAPRMVLLLAIALPFGFQTMERPRDWNSLEAVLDTDIRAYPGHYLPAFLKIMWIQLLQGSNREARDTASSIAASELRNIAVELVDVEDAMVDASATGKPQEAIALLRKLGVDLKQPPVQTKWNSPMSYVWRYCQHIVLLKWEYLVKQFPEDMSVRYYAGLWMLDVHEYENAAVYLLVAVKSQRIPEPVRGAAFYNLGLALANSGQVARAEAPLLAALEQPQPDLRAYCLLSKVYRQAGRTDDAARTKASCPGGASDQETAQ